MVFGPLEETDNNTADDNHNSFTALYPVKQDELTALYSVVSTKKQSTDR